MKGLALDPSRRAARWAGAVCLLALLTWLTLPCLAAAGASPWPMERGNATRQGRAEVDGPATLGLIWRIPLDSSVTLSPVTGSDGSIHVAVGETLVTIRSSGTEAWRHQVGAKITGLAAGPEGDVYVATAAKQVMALMPAGQLRWSLPIRPTGALVALDDGTVGIGTSFDGVQLVSSSGQQLWMYETKPSCPD